MTREEAKKIIITIRLNFDNFCPNLTNEELSLLINQWELQFKNESYATVYKAVQYYISVFRYPPKVADIKSIIYDMVRGSKTLTGEEAWSLVRKAASNSLYHAQEEYDKLPEVIRGAISPRTLRELGETADDYVKQSIKKTFLDDLKVVQESLKRDVAVSSISNDIKKIGTSTEAAPLLETSF